MFNKILVDQFYFHINNGGVSISITDEIGPTIEFSAKHFGTTTNQAKWHTNTESLREMGLGFLKAANLEYTTSPEYDMLSCYKFSEEFSVFQMSSEGLSEEDISENITDLHKQLNERKAKELENISVLENEIVLAKARISHLESAKFIQEQEDSIQDLGKNGVFGNIDSDNTPICCRFCEGDRENSLYRRFVTCGTCGNKRCPKATHHDNVCTNSNEPGQEGSDW